MLVSVQYSCHFFIQLLTILKEIQSAMPQPSFFPSPYFYEKFFQLKYVLTNNSTHQEISFTNQLICKKWKYKRHNGAQNGDDR